MGFIVRPYEGMITKYYTCYTCCTYHTFYTEYVYYYYYILVYLLYLRITLLIYIYTSFLGLPHDCCFNP